MVDREKVIKGLEHCIADNCDLCPYDENVDCPGFDPTPKTLLADVLALLKAQEPEALDMPKPDSEIGCWYDITHNYTLEQVVSALKAQEPRVITLEEAKQWCDIHPHKQNPIMDKLQFVYTSDCVPVVRCAYCKHCFDLSNDPMGPYDGESEWYCERFDRDTSAYEIDPYRFFCADGERRDDGALSGR
jgi:hypothetical protein